MKNLKINKKALSTIVAMTLVVGSIVGTITHLKNKQNTSESYSQSYTFDDGTKSTDNYVIENNEYWVSEQSYEKYLNYDNDGDVFPYQSNVINPETGEECIAYEFAVAKKTVADYHIEEINIGSAKVSQNYPVYDFEITKLNSTDIEPELVLASDGNYYLQTPNYYTDEDGNKHAVEGSALQLVERKLKELENQNESEKVKVK